MKGCWCLSPILFHSLSLPSCHSPIPFFPIQGGERDEGMLVSISYFLSLPSSPFSSICHPISFLHDRGTRGCWFQSSIHFHFLPLSFSQSAIPFFSCTRGRGMLASFLHERGRGLLVSIFHSLSLPSSPFLLICHPLSFLHEIGTERCWCLYLPLPSLFLPSLSPLSDNGSSPPCTFLPVFPVPGRAAAGAGAEAGGSSSSSLPQ